MSAPYRLRGVRPAQDLPADHVLGPCVRSYRAAANRNMIWGATPFVLLLGYVVWLDHQGLLFHWFNSTFSMFAVTALLVLSIALIAFTSVAGGAEVIRVHANGLLDLRSSPRVVRWDEMRTLTAIADEAGTVAGHFLRTSDGAVLRFGPSVGDVAQLVDELRIRMVEHKLPALLARLAEGRNDALRAFPREGRRPSDGRTRTAVGGREGHRGRGGPDCRRWARRRALGRSEAGRSPQCVPARGAGAQSKRAKRGRRSESLLRAGARRRCQW